MAESLYHETVGRLTLDGFQKEWYGQGNIYKDWDAYYKNLPLPCYAPDDEVAHGNTDWYSPKDFLRIARGNKTIADRLFEYVDWQHPESVFEDWLGCEEIVKDEKGRLICNPEDGYEDVFV